MKERLKNREVIPTVKAREEFSELISRASYVGERTVIGKQNRPAAAIVPMEDYSILELLEDFIDIKEALLAKAESKKGRTFTSAEIRKKLGLKP